MSAVIIALNIGSSSVKAAIFAADTLALLLRAEVSGIGTQVRAEFASPREPHAATPASPPTMADAGAAIGWLLDELGRRVPGMRIVAVGHRVAHGGLNFAEPVHVDAGVLRELDALVPLAPQHQPAALAAIRLVARLLPDVPQFACFDTAFHRSQSRLAQWFALPRTLSESGIVRFGFHGLSYEYIASALPGILGGRARGRIVVAHLGSGASLCALSGLRSVATTMGFTPLDGLMMSTRCGSLDPGVLLYLLQHRRLDVDEVAALLGERSGLLGVSGISSDVRELEASGDVRAHEALAMFADRAAAAVAAMGTALGGLDALVFTAGVGEHAAGVRASICARLRWLGVELDMEANARHAQRINRPGSRVDVLVIPTDEEVVLARAARRLLDGEGPACQRARATCPGVDADHKRA